MRRPVIVWVDDPDVTHLDITYCYTDEDNWPEPVYNEFVNVPYDDQLVGDIDTVTDLVSHSEVERGAAMARLRETFSLDKDDT